MNQGTRDEARFHVSASPEGRYEMVADVTAMGEWTRVTAHGAELVGEAARTERRRG
jgi:hypothetical protein